MIPKYVYDEMKEKARDRLRNARDKVLLESEAPIKKIGEKLLAEEVKAGRIRLRTRVGTSIDRYGQVPTIRAQVDLRVDSDFSENELSRKIEKETERITSEIKKKLKKLDDQYEAWEIKLFQMIANGEDLTLPEFKA